MERKDTKLPSLLVTGSHRSGTTWIGRVIESSGDFLYIDEPTSFSDIPGSLSSIQYWFQYIQPEDKEEVQALLRLKQQAHDSHKGALFKDPLAFFSIGTFIDSLQTDVLVSVRHPAAFVSSLKRLGWTHDFHHFLHQESLMETYLYPFRDQVSDFARHPKGIIDQGILLWNIIYLNVLKFKQQYPEIYVVRHEDLSLNPLAEFQKIFDYFGIVYTDRTKNFIVSTTSQSNSAEAENNVTHQLYRDAKANIYNFKHRLSREEIRHIRKGTENVSHIFYDQEWWDEA